MNINRNAFDVYTVVVSAALSWIIFLMSCCHNVNATSVKIFGILKKTSLTDLNTFEVHTERERLSKFHIIHMYGILTHTTTFAGKFIQLSHITSIIETQSEEVNTQRRVTLDAPICQHTLWTRLNLLES